MVSCITDDRKYCFPASYNKIIIFFFHIFSKNCKFYIKQYFYSNVSDNRTTRKNSIRFLIMILSYRPIISVGPGDLAPPLIRLRISPLYLFFNVTKRYKPYILIMHLVSLFCGPRKLKVYFFKL